MSQAGSGTFCQSLAELHNVWITQERKAGISHLSFNDARYLAMRWFNNTRSEIHWKYTEIISLFLVNESSNLRLHSWCWTINITSSLSFILLINYNFSILDLRTRTFLIAQDPLQPNVKSVCILITYFIYTSQFLFIAIYLYFASITQKVNNCFQEIVVSYFIRWLGYSLVNLL